VEQFTTFALSYEVSRDGSVVANTMGVSYYDDGLDPATSYTYQVVAINSTGDNSAPSSVMLNTPGRRIDDDDEDDSPIFDVNPDIAEPADLYRRDGYSVAKVTG
jgi:hypothetical protein